MRRVTNASRLAHNRLVALGPFYDYDEAAVLTGTDRPLCAFCSRTPHEPGYRWCRVCLARAAADELQRRGLPNPAPPRTAENGDVDFEIQWILFRALRGLEEMLRHNPALAPRFLRSIPREYRPYLAPGWKLIPPGRDSVRGAASARRPRISGGVRPAGAAPAHDRSQPRRSGRTASGSWRR